MSIQTIIRTFVAVSGLSLALAGSSWAEEPAANDDNKANKGSVETAPPADADESADVDHGSDGDHQKAETPDD
jgi:hypothetical protein